MPYKTVPKHLHGLTLAQANRWGSVFDAVQGSTGDSEKAARVAWGVMRKAIMAVRVPGHTRNGHYVKPYLRMMDRAEAQAGPGERIVYRASNENAPEVGTHYTEQKEHAVAYTDNSGFGGSKVHRYAIKPQNVADTVGEERNGLRGLALAYLRALDPEDAAEVKEKTRRRLGVDDDERITSKHVAQDWDERGLTHVFHVLEHDPRVEQAISQVHDWIRFEDDFPEGSITWKRLGGEKPMNKGLVLEASDTNPAVKRWKQIDRGHSEEGHRFLSRVHAGGGQMAITQGHADEPHVKRLLREKLIQLKRNPGHHWNEYTAHLTKEGTKYHEAYRAAHEQTGKQESLFKGVVCIYMIRSDTMRKSILEKAVIPALDMVPEDLEEDATPNTWTENGYTVSWRRGKRGHGSVTFEGNGLAMPFVMTAAGKKHARIVARDASALLAKGKIPLLDGVFRMRRKT